MFMRKIIFFILLISVNYTFCQQEKSEDKDSVKTFVLSVNSAPENARIYLDTVFIGLTPLKNYKIHPGEYKLKIINPLSPEEWQSENELIDLAVSGDTSLFVKFRYYYYFNSDPFNAEVKKEDSLFGYTPLRFFSDEKITGSMLFRKKNYTDYFFNLSEYNFETGANIKLKSKGKETINDIVYKNRTTQFKTQRNLYAILGFGATAVAGGFFSVNFKTKANDNYTDYLTSGDNFYLNESNKYDKYFVASIIIMQLAIGGLMYYLFFD